MTDTTQHMVGLAEQPTGGPGRFFGLPRTTLGRWSLAGAALFWMFMALFFGAVSADVRGGIGTTFADSWPLWMTSVPGAVCGITAAVTGVPALFSKGERSVLVVLSTLLGLFVAFYVFAEIAFPH